MESRRRSKEELNEKVSRSATSRILLHPKMEKTLFDLKDRTLAVRSIMAKVWHKPGVTSTQCRLCGKDEENVIHVLSKCKELN